MRPDKTVRVLFEMLDCGSKIEKLWTGANEEQYPELE